MMYVVCVFMILSYNVFSQTITDYTTPISQLSGLLNQNQMAQYMAIQQQMESMEAKGINHAQCGNHISPRPKWRTHRRGAKAGLEIGAGSSIDSLPAGSCGNPNRPNYWGDWLATKAVIAETFDCCYTSPTNWSDYNCVELCMCKGCHDNGGLCEKACNDKRDSLVEEAKTKIDSYCQECKTLLSMQRSWNDAIQATGILAQLYETIFGGSPGDDSVYATCEQKCAHALNESIEAYEACLCSNTQTLADGITEPCRPASKCEVDICREQYNAMLRDGLCSQIDCQEEYEKCKCSKFGLVYDPRTGQCAESVDSPPPREFSDYDSNDFGPSGSDLTSSSDPDGAGSALSSSLGLSSGAGGLAEDYGSADEYDEEEIEKEGFDADRRGLTSAGMRHDMHGSGHGAFAAYEASRAKIRERAHEEIAKDDTVSIWDMIHEVYEEGITANRFLQAEL